MRHAVDPGYQLSGHQFMDLYGLLTDFFLLEKLQINKTPSLPFSLLLILIFSSPEDYLHAYKSYTVIAITNANFLLFLLVNSSNIL